MFILIILLYNGPLIVRCICNQ